LLTIFGQAIFTLITAFTADYPQFVWAQIFTRVFGYAEEMLCFVVIAEEVAAGARGWANGTLCALNYTGAGLASLAFLGVNVLPYGWRALYAIGAVPLFLVAFLRRSLPETKRFVALENVEKTKSKWSETLQLLRDLTRQYPLRLLTILIAAGTFGFGVSSASVLSSKYLQSVFHYSPLDINLVFIPGGLVGLALAITAGRLSDRIGRKITTLCVISLSGIGFAFFYSGLSGWWLPVLWVVSFFGFFSGEAMISGYGLEIVPTQYRATVSGLRYLVYIGMGAVSLALEGRLYDHFHAHGPAIQVLLTTVPITLAAILFLPEPAGKTLEEMAA
jgi:putative MFS transporter